MVVPALDNYFNRHTAGYGQLAGSSYLVDHRAPRNFSWTLVAVFFGDSASNAAADGGRTVCPR